MRKKIGQSVVGVALLCGLVACTANHHVRTVGKRNVSVSGSLGGPVINNLSAPIVAPNAYVGVRYGLREDLDISADYNLTSPFIPGIGLDLIVAAHWVPVQPGVGFQAMSPERGWGFSNTFSLHSISDFINGYVAIPLYDVAFGWRYRWFNPFLGVALGLNFFRPFEEDNISMVSPYVGCDFILNEKASISIKAIVYDVANNMNGTQIKWVHLVDDPAYDEKYGVLGFIVGFSWIYQRGEAGQ